MDEGVAKGFIEAPGYFDSTYKRRAYQKVIWKGPAPPIIDPIREAKYAEEKIKLGMSTRTQETATLTGGDWAVNAQEIGFELQIMKKNGWTDQLNQGGGNQNAKPKSETADPAVEPSANE